MWIRLTPDQAAGLYRVASQTAADAASEFYESALQPRTAPGHDGPWSLLRVRRHADISGVLTWQFANVEPEQLDWPAFDPLAGASNFLLLTRARLEPLIDLLRQYAADLPPGPARGPAFSRLSEADLIALGLSDRVYPDHRQTFHVQAYDPLDEGHRALMEMTSVAPHPAYYFHLGLGGYPGDETAGPARLNLDRAGHESLADLLADELPTLK
jgi:hypothetical protein